MTYSGDWRIHKSSSTVFAVGLATGSSIYTLGTAGGSLVATTLTGSGSFLIGLSNAACLAVRANASQQGAIIGYMQTTFQLVRAVNGANTVDAGIFFMQQTSNITISNTSCYGFVWTTAASGTFAVKKYNSGLTTATTLATVSGVSVASGTEMSMKVSWVQSGSTVQIVAYASAGSGFTYTSSLYSLIDSSSAFSRASAEGIGLVEVGAAGGVFALFDQTTLSGLQ